MSGVSENNQASLKNLPKIIFFKLYNFIDEKISLKLIGCVALVLCFSFNLKAQLPIKNSALTGEWKLTALNGEYDSYSYDCEKKKFHMSYDMLFALGEKKADIFEKETIKEAEKSFLKVKTNGDYELALGTGSVEKGTWKSKAVDKLEEGFIPNRFGYLVLTSDSETLDVVIIIDGQQLSLSVSTRPDGGLKQEYVFRKDFKGSAFK